MSGDVETLGQRIRRLREAKRVTLRQLAYLVGVSAPFMHDVEMGRRNTDKLEAIAEALGVSADDLTILDTRNDENRLEGLERRVRALEERERMRGWRA